jgi:hypothetical protein
MNLNPAQPSFLAFQENFSADAMFYLSFGILELKPRN